MPEQRAFSPGEVATMLGIDPTTVSSLITSGELGSKAIGDDRRIFLSDLEDYLGVKRAHSLVRDINSDDGEARKGTPEGSIDFEVIRDSGNHSNRARAYEAVVRKWREIDEDEKAIVLADLSENDVQNIKDLLYRRIGKENIIIRTAEQEDSTFKAVVSAREDSEYLREE